MVQRLRPSSSQSQGALASYDRSDTHELRSLCSQDPAARVQGQEASPVVVIDLTAGNRHIWGGWIPEIPEDGPVIFCDLEPYLKHSPDVVCDLRAPPFREGVAHATVVDPPYWNFGTSRFHGDPQEAQGSWWGNFRNLTYLRSILRGIVKSVSLLRPGGRMYLKWCDVVYKWTRFSPMFFWDWEEEARLERRSQSGRNVKPCYWFTLRAREEKILS